MSAFANPTFLTGPSAVTWACPFKHPTDALCLASTPCDGEFGFVPSRRCEDEGHDTCPLYLAKVLCGLRPSPAPPPGELRTK